MQTLVKNLGPAADSPSDSDIINDYTDLNDEFTSIKDDLTALLLQLEGPKGYKYPVEDLKFQVIGNTKIGSSTAQAPRTRTPKSQNLKVQQSSGTSSAKAQADA